MIVGARYPHMIHHISATFSKLTGMASVDLVGREASKFLKNKEKGSSKISVLSKPESNNGTIEDLPATFRHFQHQVIPVSSSENEILTHMLLEFKKEGSPNASISVIG